MYIFNVIILFAIEGRALYYYGTLTEEMMADLQFSYVYLFLSISNLMLLIYFLSDRCFINLSKLGDDFL